MAKIGGEQCGRWGQERCIILWWREVRDRGAGVEIRSEE